MTRDPIVHYCIVRSDLPRGVQAAQLVHAAGESSPGNLSSDTLAVVLSVSDAAELVRLANRLTLAGVPHKLIIETTGVYAGQPLALGVVPGSRSTLKRYMANLPLLR